MVTSVHGSNSDESSHGVKLHAETVRKVRFSNGEALVFVAPDNLYHYVGGGTLLGNSYKMVNIEARGGREAKKRDVKDKTLDS